MGTYAVRRINDLTDQVNDLYRALSTLVVEVEAAERARRERGESPLLAESTLKRANEVLERNTD
jgi:hypothetical protein